MTTEEQLKNLVLSVYGSVREFSNVLGMPYSTLDSIFKRGVENASIGNIIKICSALNISVDELAAGKIMYRNIPEMDADEIELISLYRSVNEYGKKFILATARHASEDADMQKEKQNTETA